MDRFASPASLERQHNELIAQPTQAIDQPYSPRDMGPLLVAYASKIEGDEQGQMSSQLRPPDAVNQIALANDDNNLQKVIELGTPDYTVLAHSGLNGNKLGIASFALVNPLTKTYTFFASGKGKVQTPLGPLDAVFSRNLLTGENQAGLGKAFPMGAGKPPPVVGFINIKGTFPDVGRKAAIAFGVFGNLAALPPGNAALNVLRKSKGSVGAGWTGSIENLGGGKIKVVASGVDITSLFTGQRDNSTTTDKPGLANYGNKDQAKYNNYQAYMTGANPYALAATSKGMNHGDQLIKFANNVEQVRKDLDSMGVYTQINPVGKGVTRTNKDAGRILEVALSPGAKERYAKYDPTGKKWLNVQTAMSFIGSNGLSEKFSEGNPTVRSLTGKWPASGTSELIPSKERPFILDVLNGSFRKESVDPSVLQKAYDLVVGIDFGSFVGNDPVGGKYEFPGDLRPVPIAELYFKNSWTQTELKNKYGKDPMATAQLDFISANTSKKFVSQFSDQPGKAFAVTTDGGKTHAAMVKYLKTERGPILVIQMVGLDGKPSSPSVGYSVKTDGSLAYP